MLLKKPERAKRTIKGLSITREKFAPSSVRYIHASYNFLGGSVAYPAGSFSQVASSLAIQQRSHTHTHTHTYIYIYTHNYIHTVIYSRWKVFLIDIMGYAFRPVMLFSSTSVLETSPQAQETGTLESLLVPYLAFAKASLV